MRSISKLITVLIILAVLVIISFTYTPYDPLQSSGKPYQQPTWDHILGTDGLGRDILSQMIVGSKTTVFIALISSVTALSTGLIIGLISAIRGIISDIISSIIDSFIVIPPLLIMILVSSTLGPSIISEIIAIGFSYWPQVAKTVRAETLSVLERPYVEASRSIGGEYLWILKSHIMPNISHVVLANFSYTMAMSLVSESIISFLGLGDQRYFSWGLIFYYAFIQGAIYYGLWLWVLAPAVMISLISYMFLEAGRSIISR